MKKKEAAELAKMGAICCSELFLGATGFGLTAIGILAEEYWYLAIPGIILFSIAVRSFFGHDDGHGPSAAGTINIR